jgi:hypothetical protein
MPATTPADAAKVITNPAITFFIVFALLLNYTYSITSLTQLSTPNPKKSAVADTFFC